MAVDTLKEVMPGLLKGQDVTPPFSLSLDVEPRISALRYAITLSNQKILHAATTNPALTGMGTTITAVLLCHGTAFIAHVGDSRAYLLRSGQCDQITNDHSFVAEQIRAGKLNAEQAKTSAYRHIITRAVGIDREVAVDHATIAVKENDTLLLCTDGLTEMIDDGEICAILAGSAPEAATENLIRRANEQGGVDNITAVVLKILANG
jgi:protein phosphatase